VKYKPVLPWRWLQQNEYLQPQTEPAVSDFYFQPTGKILSTTNLSHLMPVTGAGGAASSRNEKYMQELGLTKIEIPSYESFAAELKSHQDFGAYIRSVAADVPTRRAVTHLVRGEEEGEILTYEALDRVARSLGALFQAKRAQGERAILLFDAGVNPIAAFLGCLYARVIAVPLPAPLSGKVDRYLARLESVLKDAGVKFVLTTTDIVQRLQGLVSAMPAFSDVEWITIDTLKDRSDEWEEEAIQETDIALLQYTSGSTSVPKGVMISHGNLLKICEYNGELLEFPTKGICTVCWMPYFHDAGLIEGLLIPLYHGLSVHIMSALDFVQNPVRWLKAIHRYRASHSCGPNFAYELCVRKTTPKEREALDLSCWKRANVSAEPISSGTIQRFLDTFASCGFKPEAIAPAWGLAEATLAVTATAGATFHVLNAADLEQNHAVYSTGRGPARTMVGCGKVLKGLWNINVRIVDPVTCKACPDGTVGEAWVSGEVIAQGYWNRPVETKETFKAQISGEGGDYFLRTGDLGFMAGDEFVFTGRRKDLIIVEGRNHYPQDIEKTVEKSHPALRPGCSIAFSLEDDGQVQVIVVAELNKEFRLDEDLVRQVDPRVPVSQKDIVKAVRRDVAEEHQIRVHQLALIPTACIPKTTSGKLQRSACKEKFLKGTFALQR
jgi:acyl-CoA synthetase (AMP-forming)/AMP-acid ligase II